MKSNPNYIDIEIDQLTDSIVCKITGEHYETDVKQMTMEDWRLIKKIKGWKFDWNLELSYEDRDVYAVVKKEEPELIQGLVSCRSSSDHYYMEKIESAPFNVGKEKMYEGVAGNLFAYVCKLSMEAGFDGVICFLAKTKLIDHYIETVGARVIGHRKLAIHEKEAQFLIDKYFKSSSL
ncbi:MAG: hypothetical protein JO154_09935 [Chitinophaga sp.]|uniref:hypothetical protein n=1 Tax=Chitinophaga sp. TaxID=1869181 RepID=UPI0025C3C6DB|nr:hypothetical protein [Chitinophaga sp.]MBV8252912.1 hypothetical protein [Chitinophaga sp.]